MNKYTCTDDGSHDTIIEAESAQEAARAYVDGGDWGQIEATTWVDIRVTEVVEARYDASGVEGYGFLRDMRDAAPESV